MNVHKKGSVYAETRYVCSYPPGVGRLAELFGM